MQHKFSFICAMLSALALGGCGGGAEPAPVPAPAPAPAGAGPVPPPVAPPSGETDGPPLAPPPLNLIERDLAPSSTAAGLADAYGNHVVVVPQGLRAGGLFVHLPGTGGKPGNSRLILREAAGQGLHAIGLAYPNVPTVESLCSDSPDPDCYEKVRLEIIDGTDRTPLVAVNRANSIEQRLIAALTLLAQEQPGEGWGQFLADGQPVWRVLRLSGHSQGGGHAPLMARDRAVARVCMFGAPKDFSNVLLVSPGWMSQTKQTPAERFFGFNHQEDSQPQTLRNWAALGLGAFGPPVAVDGVAPPFGGSRQLTTQATPALAGQFHGSVVVDRNTPLAADGSPLFKSVWRHMCFL